MRKELILLCVLFVLFGCKKQQSRVYDARLLELRQYINNYDFAFPYNNEADYDIVDTSDTLHSLSYIQTFRDKYLDSALLVVNELEHMDLTHSQKSEISMMNAELHFFKQDYKSAIEALRHVDRGLPSMKIRDAFINKMEIKQAQMNDDTVALDSLYRVIINNYQNYYNDVEVIFKRTLRQKDTDKAFFSLANTILVEIFHYKLQLEGKERVLEQIDSLQLVTKGNKDYFDRLKNLFIEDNYEVFFE